ncbi:Putative lipoprotein [Arthrobacter sp. 9AX]|nr:Putative lipoprotein [Arthrobacter sp. 9AX]
MKVVRAGMAAAALSLWLSSCVTAPPVPAPPSAAPLVDAGPGPTATAAPADPAPQPQDPPPPGSAAIPGPLEPQSQGLPATSAGASPDGTPVPSATAAEVPASESPAPSARGRSGNGAEVQTVTAYFVMLDDGGSNGVRFGCNDSLVGVARNSSGAEEPLPAAVGTLLDTSAASLPSTPGTGLYNSLSGSDLKFLSGSFDGTTVTVYLAGTLSLGGVCDIPRVEAQLTQTAVAAVGAIRAEIYVNGRGLTEALRLN